MMVAALFINACILVTVTYALSLTYRQWPFAVSRVSHLQLAAYSAMGILLMHFPAEISPGVLLDLRAVPVILVTIRYGIHRGIGVAMPILLIRAAQGGAGVWSAVLGLLAVIVVASVARRRGVTFEGLIGRQMGWAALLVLPYPFPLALVVNGAALFWQFLIPVLVFNAAGLVLCASILAGRFQTLGALHHLTHLAEGDALTGLSNRRRFDADLLNMKSQDALLLIDIDHFKQVNDTFGHAVGDEVLREVARCLSSQIRMRDTVYRYGGEEFAVILRRVAPTSLAKASERIREAVEHCCLPVMDGGSVTISIGVAVWADQTSLMKRADEALYAAKRAGRNRVHIHPG